MNDIRLSEKGKSHRKPKRIIAFRILSILIPFLILAILEILLRSIHYGSDLSVFMDYPTDRTMLMLNPDASKRYFSNQKNATTGNVEPFKKVKDANTTRIFVLGESTTIGYPYFHNGSFHRWLQYRLTHNFPDRNFEIINLALTAVNTYTVLGFAKEIVKYQPDAVLIYTGHNEYYGALGVGSTEQIGGSRFLIKLMLQFREFRFVQLLNNAVEKITTSAQEEQDGTRMQRMVASQKIEYQSELYQRGVEQFQVNINEILKVLNRHNIPVLVSDLVSNEKDLKPFVSFPVDSSHFPAFKINYDLGIKAVAHNDTGAALKYFSKANHSYGRHALCNYFLGKLYFGKDNFNEAKKYFSKARDLDGLRFRAPSEFNSILKKLTAQYKNAQLVDMTSVFESNSAGKSIGNELMTEHVHPDLKGYALMSDAFYKVLQKQNVIPINPKSEMTFAGLISAMPITKVDSLSGIYKVAKLKGSWPFTESLQTASFDILTSEQKLAYDLANRKISWLDAMNRLYEIYIAQRDLKNARKTVETLILEFPYQTEYYLKSAMLSGELMDENQALFNFRKAFSLIPSFDTARYIFVLLLKTDQPKEAIPYLDYAIQNNSSAFDLRPVRQLVSQVVTLKSSLEKDTANTELLSQISQVYLKMDNKSGAIKYLHKILQTDSHNRNAQLQLSKLEN